MYSNETLPFDEDAISAATETAEKEPMTCPLCGGRILTFNWGYGCANYQQGCKFSAGTIAQRKISEDEVRALCEKGETDVLDGFVSKKTGKPFSAKLFVDKEEEKVSFKFPERVVDESMRCPECGSPMRKFDWGYGCANYPDCRFSVRKTIAGKTLSEDEIKTLLNEKKLPKMDGFLSKKGTTFSAALEIVDGNVKFVFED